MTSFSTRPAHDGVCATIRVPGDKSISHRALILAALSEGTSHLTGLSDGLDVVHTRHAVAALGAGVVAEPDGSLTVKGGRDRLREPESVIDVGNSGTGIRLLSGVAAGIDGLTVLAGDESIARRPMDRVAAPLRLMGARVDGRRAGRLPPLVVRGGQLHGIDYRLPVPSAQVKGAILLAALAADGPTTVREDNPSRLHSEEMLKRCGVDIEVAPGRVTLHPGLLRPVDVDVPGDPSQAAFWVVAACITPGSDLTIPNVYVGPGRVGFLDVLRRMGADIALESFDPATSTADIRARYAPLVATEVAGPEIPALIDEIPVLAVAAAMADGVTTFSDAAELRVKESDRIDTVVATMESLGVGAEGRPDGLVVRGRSGRRFDGGHVESAGDHRIAMAAAVAGLACTGVVDIAGWDAVATSYPGFEEDYRQCAS